MPDTDSSDPTVLGVTYHVAGYPIPDGVPDLGDVLSFRVTRVDTRDYLPAGVQIDVTVTPAWEEHRTRLGCSRRDPHPAHDFETDWDSYAGKGEWHCGGISS